jgi:hypothetical protein
MQKETDAQEMEAYPPLLLAMFRGADQEEPFHRSASPSRPTAIQNDRVSQEME